MAEGESSSAPEMADHLESGAAASHKGSGSSQSAAPPPTLNATLLPPPSSSAIAGAGGSSSSSSSSAWASCAEWWGRRAAALEPPLLRWELRLSSCTCLLPGRRRLLWVVRGLRGMLASAHRAAPEIECWRGMRDLVLTSSFLSRGGTEIAPLSTTSSLEVAVAYLLMQDEGVAGSPSADSEGSGGQGGGFGQGDGPNVVPSAASGRSLLFRILVSNPLQCGADLTFLSFFANESEVLYPPLTFLKPTGAIAQVEFRGAKVVVLDVEPYFPS